MSPALVRVALFAALAFPAPSQSISSKADGLDDERLLQAWSYLTPAEQRDAADWLVGEAPSLGTFQAGLIRFGLTLEENDIGLLPDAVATPVFDPEVHAPGLPIPRRWLDPDDRQARAQRELVFKRVPKSDLLRAWEYDWGRGQVVRLGGEDDAERLFENALRGFPPDLDLAQALVERALDDGAERSVHAAFAHAYTDRAGNVFPGVTLYDVWAWGGAMEMPDVDALGIVHMLDDDWKTWVSPVPDSQHDALYEHIAVSFVRGRRHRGLRTALAMTYLTGSAELRDGYPGHLDRLHSLWDVHSSLPSAVAAVIPAAEGWDEFLQRWSLEVDSSLELTMAGTRRRETLDADARQVRDLAARILTEMGALERKRRPDPKPAPKPTGEGKRKKRS
jgi:hypothetical protein